ncbi:hypothetical protein Tco_1496972 [Tanacetum coccineum]
MASRRISFEELWVFGKAPIGATNCFHTDEEMAEDGFGAYWLGSERVIPDKEDLRNYWIEISSDRDFLGLAPSYEFIRDPVRRLCHRIISCSISGKGQAPKKVVWGTLHWASCSSFGLVSDQGMSGLLVVATSRPERQPNVAAGAPEAAEDAPAVD